MRVGFVGPDEVSTELFARQQLNKSFAASGSDKVRALHSWALARVLSVA